MSEVSTAREALIAEVIGDVAKLAAKVEALRLALVDTCQALERADAGLRRDLEGFERRTVAITEHAKAMTARYIATRADEAAGRSIERQSRAMADAARVAFGVELGGTMQRLQAQLRPLLEERTGRWQRWLTHAAAAAGGAAIMWVLMLSAIPR